MNIRLMGASLAGFLVLAACSVTGGSGDSDDVVTFYGADGLHGGKNSYLATQFKEFTEETGIKVDYVEAGSGETTSRVIKEKANAQADVMLVLPPFIQQAAQEGVLKEYTPKGADHVPSELKDPDKKFIALDNNYVLWIYNTDELTDPPKTWDDLLDSKFKNKLQYSTPAQAADGTAVLINAIHVFGSEDAALKYLHKLQENNVGPSSSTGKLAALVAKGELVFANGETQLSLSQIEENDYSNMDVTLLAGPDGKKYTFAMPFHMGLVDGPHPENGKKLMDFLLTKKSQSKISPTSFGIPVRDDVEPTGQVKKVVDDLLSDATVWNPDWVEIASNIPSLVKRWQEATKG